MKRSSRRKWPVAEFESALCRGMSLVELLVVMFITIVIASVVYSMIVSSKHTVAVTQARGEAKSMAEIVLRRMERDLSAVVADVQTSGVAYNATPTADIHFYNHSDGWEMEVQEENDKKTVRYRYNKPKLYRSIDSGTENLLCANIEYLTVSRLNDQGQFEIAIKVGIIPSGQREPQIHHQVALATVRQAIETNLDSRWRTTKDVLNSF